MKATDVLIDIYDRLPALARDALDGMDGAALVTRPGPAANPIGWLVWHMGRVIDAQVSAITDEQQTWVEEGWAPRFGLDADPDNTGYGHRPAQVDEVVPDSSDSLIQYLDAVLTRTASWLRSLQPEDLDRVIDDSYDPPVTVGIRLTSIADDCLQHAGQAAYARGLILGGRAVTP